MPDIRVLLVDDNPEFLATAQSLLSLEQGIRVVGTALSARDGLELARREPPDVLLLDLLMPEMNGLEATPSFKELPGNPRVVIVSMNDEASFRMAAAQVGADGFIAKAELASEGVVLLRALCRELA